MYFDSSPRFEGGGVNAEGSLCSEFRYIAPSQLSTGGPKYVNDWVDHSVSKWSDNTPGPGAYDTVKAREHRVRSPHFVTCTKKEAKPPVAGPGPGSYYLTSSMIKPSFNRKLQQNHGRHIVNNSQDRKRSVVDEVNVSAFSPPPVELVRSSLEERREVRSLLRNIIKTQQTRELKALEQRDTGTEVEVRGES